MPRRSIAIYGNLGSNINTSVLGSQFHGWLPYPGDVTDKVVSKSDTVLITDTIHDSIPYPVYETLVRTIPEPFPVYITLDGDTVKEPVYVPVPITSKEYKTDDYKLSISGYKPNLDYIEVYRKTEYITKTITPVDGGIGADSRLWDR